MDESKAFHLAVSNSSIPASPLTIPEFGPAYSENPQSSSSNRPLPTRPTYIIYATGKK